MRRLVPIALPVGLVAVPAPAWAHGLGGRADLPVPVEFFVVGAVLVLFLSFAALAVLWPTPRLQGGPTLRRLGPKLSGTWWRTLQALGVALFVLVVAAGVGGSQSATRNIAPVTVWVGFWLVVPFLGAILGNLWTPLNPWRTLAEWLRLGDGSEGGWLDRWGVIPAAVAFLAFTWMELVYPDGSRPRMLAVAALAYSAYLLVWVSLAGRREAFAVADAFTVYNRLISSIAPFGRDPEGRLVWRGWLRALPTLPQSPGMVLFVVAMIGTVTYDGLSATSWWNSLGALSTAGRSILSETVGLLVTVGVIGGAYLLACRSAARIAGTASTGEIARSFAHTLIPIGLAYAVAHYFTFILFEGQLFLRAVSDPFGFGWDLFGTGHWEVDYTWLSPSAVWYVQVAVIVGGHLLGVVLAHDRALAVFPPRVAVRTQYAMLGLMVLLTGLGLLILAAR